MVSFPQAEMEEENSNKEEGVRGEVTQLRRIADLMEKTTNYRTGEVTELRGIRNALEEILLLVKKDMQKYEKMNIKRRYL